MNHTSPIRSRTRLRAIGGLAAGVVGIALGMPVMAAATTPPHLSRIGPNSGSTAGGTAITITGSNFFKVRSVLFGSSPATSVHVLSPTKIVVSSPRHAAGRVAVRIVAAAGASPLVAADLFNYGAPPVVTGLSTHAVPISGGTRVTLTGKNLTGTLAVTVGTTPATAVAVASGSSLQFTTPPHAPAVVDVRVRTKYATSASSAADQLTFVPAPAAWNTAMVDPSQGDPTAISCASASFCMAVDGLGSAFQHTASGWSAGAKVIPRGTPTLPSLVAVSCAPAQQWCVAVGRSGTAAVFNGTSWTHTTISGSPNLVGVSCVSATFCVAVADGSANQAYAFDGAAWTALSASTDTYPLTSVSCPSKTLCVLGDTHDQVLSFNGMTWGSPISVVGSIGTVPVAAISCPLTMFCMEVDQNGATRTSTDTTAWSPSGSALPSPTSLSCATSTFCTATNPYSAVQWTGTWNTGPTFQYGGAASCPTSIYCELIEPSGFADRWDQAQGWTQGTVPFDPVNLPEGISCGSSVFCAEVDALGLARAFHADAWGSPVVANDDQPFVLPDPGPGVRSVSCTSATFCMAASTRGPVVYNGSTWTRQTTGPLGGADLEVVTCTSSAFCVAGAGGSVAFYISGTWSALGDIDGSSEVTGLACAPTKLCVAVDGAGRAMAWNGSTWSSPTYVDLPHALRGVSCTTSGCVVIDDIGQLVRYDGHTWTAPVDIASGRPLTGISCLSTGICYALGDGFVVSIIGSWHAAQNVAFDGAPVAISCVDGPTCRILSDSGEVISAS